MPTRLISAVLLASATLLCCGCGKGHDLGAPVPITGIVTLEGQPLANTTVGFVAIGEGIPARYRFASAVTDATGAFSLKEVYQTEYMVTISDATSQAPEATETMAPATTGNPRLAQYGPESTLRARVNSENPPFKFEL